MGTKFSVWVKTVKERRRRAKSPFNDSSDSSDFARTGEDDSVGTGRRERRLGSWTSESLTTGSEEVENRGDREILSRDAGSNFLTSSHPESRTTYKRTTRQPSRKQQTTPQLSTRHLRGEKSEVQNRTQKIRFDTAKTKSGVERTKSRTIGTSTPTRDNRLSVESSVLDELMSDVPDENAADYGAVWHAGHSAVSVRRSGRSGAAKEPEQESIRAGKIDEWGSQTASAFNKASKKERKFLKEYFSKRRK